MGSSIVKMDIDKSILDIDVVAASGQCFSMSKIDDSTYKVLSADRACCVRSYDDKTALYINMEDIEYWESYFNLRYGYDEHISFLSTCGVPFIEECAKYSKGMVIIKQDLWEMIVSFIISQRKSIPAIKKCLDKFRDVFGVSRRFYMDSSNYIEYKTFPTAKEFLETSRYEEKISSCGVGYRGKYIIDAARWFLDLTDKDMEILRNGTYENRMELLKEIYGVGDKVANCICLFALSDMKAFPVDVWMDRVLERELIPEHFLKLVNFPGFVQQVIFYYVINHKDMFRDGKENNYEG